MFVTNMNTYNHFHNNDLIKQKTCLTIVSNLIYIFIYLYISQLLVFIKIIYFSCSNMFTFIYMYKHVTRCPNYKFKELNRALICDYIWFQRIVNLWISITFNKEIWDYIWWEKEIMSISRKKKERKSFMNSQRFEWHCLMCIFY